MKGRSQMTSTVFGYDHIMMRAEYRTPDPHSHLAVHFIAGLDSSTSLSVSPLNFITYLLVLDVIILYK